MQADSATPTTTTLPHRFLRFLGPLLATNLLQALGGTVIVICLGQLLGARALAAAVSFYPLFMCCIAFVIGLGAGSSVLVGQAWGARDADKVRRVAGAVLVGGLALGCVVAVLGAAVIGELLRLLGTTDDVLPEAVSYARVLFLAMPVLFIHQLAAALLRGPGPVNTNFGDRVARRGGWMLGARAQQGVHLASAGNAADGPQAGQPEGKALAGAPLVVALLACAHAHAASHA